ncbi:MAG: hypothetical protein M9932_05120 [Xanthobacteraceae bacterium]|nr:hypothetical protein [Xanthobacteraceae bacterium]
MARKAKTVTRKTGASKTTKAAKSAKTVKSSKTMKSAKAAKTRTAASKATKIARRPYSKADIKELRAHSKARTPVAQIAKLTRRTVGSLRQKAMKLGIGLGHQR